MRKTLLALAAAAACAPLSAPATDGYFAHGYGMKGKGRGGASTAMTDDAFGGAVNPATMAFAGERLDLGLDWFRPDRSMKREGSTGAGAGLGGPIDANVEGNETENFFIPEFGYNTMLRPDLSLGITVYGNGGMNTDYPGGVVPAGICGPTPANVLCGQGNLGVDLAQLIFAPTISWKFHPQHSVGLSPLIGYQRFKAYGLQAFAAISSDPANLTNKGYDDAWGFGARVGYFGQITPQFAVGVGYSTKINMSEFDKYKGLFAEQGDFDIPENYNVGVAFKATPKLTIAADYQRILYNKVKSVGNPSTQPNCNPMVNFPTGPGVGPDCLGASGSSIGFGWQNVDAWKIGVEYQWSPSLTLRAGYNKSDNPITARDVTFNILAPGVIEEHVTLGFTYSIGKTTELTMAYMHAFENSVSGPANNPYSNVGGTETLTMSEDSLGIALGWKF
jgi:long-chain fatty acid transport protein